MLNNGVSIGIDHFRESAPGEVIMEKRLFGREYKTYKNYLKGKF